MSDLPDQPLPAADQPPPVTGERPFGERWKELEAKVGPEPEPEGAVAGAEPDKPKDPPKPAAKEPPAPGGADPKEAKRAQLKAIAEELGLSVEDGVVAVQERIDVRKQKSENLKWRAEREAEFAKREQEWNSTHGDKAKKHTAFADAIERGDPDAAAVAVGFKDWNDLNGTLLQTVADPNYKKLRHIEQELEERKAAEAKAEEEQKTRAEQENRQRVYNNYMRTLSDTCKASKDPVVQAFADDPVFLRDVYRIQEENWDPVAQKTITVEQAVRRAYKNGSGTLEETLKTMHARFQKAFGGAPPPAAAAPNGKKPAPKTAVTPVNTTTASNGAKKPGDMTPQEWREYTLERINRAED